MCSSFAIRLQSTSPFRFSFLLKGSMTKIKSQSTNGRSAKGCRLRAFKRVLATDPPKTVMLDKGMACFGENPMTKQ